MVNHPHRSRALPNDNVTRVGFDWFKHAVAAQFAKMTAMSGSKLFRTDIVGDILWDGYLAAFPEGSNPHFRKRTVHDCSCCKQFIRSVGNVVAISPDSDLISIWDVVAATEEQAYHEVASYLGAIVKERPIKNIFCHYEGSVGIDHNYERHEGEPVRTWEHFHLTLPNSMVLKKDKIGPEEAKVLAAHDVMLRSLKELSLEAVDTVDALITEGSLYRGDEAMHAVMGFKRYKTEFNQLPTQEQVDNFAWARAVDSPAAVTHIRNTAIGTLIEALSDGQDVEAAVRAYESKVAPANYRRSSAIVTQKMVDKARDDIVNLGLGPALARRHAKLTDIALEDILFANRSARRAISHENTTLEDAFKDLGAVVPVHASHFDNLPVVDQATFINSIVPTTSSIEVLFEDRLRPNLVSLIAPIEPKAPPLFAWNNSFSWSYVGEFADASIKQRVKRAGGNVEGDLCCRLAWSNYDDLDLHMLEPSHEEIFYAHKQSIRTGGQLDVDMNAGGSHSREPVENIFYGNTKKMIPGRYTLFVHQYALREHKDVGFEVEIDFMGRRLGTFNYSQEVRQRLAVHVATLDYDGRGGITITPLLPTRETVSQKAWRLDTEQFQRVSVIMRSPNHWMRERGGSETGNAHIFFMLAGCENDGSARPFYNEFLRTELAPHRKALEMVGARLRVEPQPEQLSGLGFSSTVRNSLIARIRRQDGATQMLKIAF